MSGNNERGDTMADSKGYNSTAPAPVDTGVGRSITGKQHSRSPSTHSASNSPRLDISTTTSEHHKRHSSTGSLQGRHGYNDSPSSTDNNLNLTPSKSHSGHLSPVLRDERSLSRGRSSSEASRSKHQGVDGRRGYNEDKGSRDSRSSSVASGSSPARRRASEAGPNFGPRPHAGMIGRKGYNTENPSAIDDAEESVGLGIADDRSSRGKDGVAGRKGYNKTPSPRR